MRNNTKRIIATVLAFLMTFGSLVFNKQEIMAETGSALIPAEMQALITQGEDLNANAPDTDLSFGYARTNEDSYFTGETVTFKASYALRSNTDRFENIHIVMTIPEYIEIDTVTMRDDGYEWEIDEDARYIIVRLDGCYGGATGVEVVWEGQIRNEELPETEGCTQESTGYMYTEMYLNTNSGSVIDPEAEVVTCFGTDSADFTIKADYQYDVEKSVPGLKRIAYTKDGLQEYDYELTYKINVVRDKKVNEIGALAFDSITITDELPKTINGTSATGYKYSLDGGVSYVGGEGGNVEITIAEAADYFTSLTATGEKYQLKQPIIITALYDKTFAMDKNATYASKMMTNTCYAEVTFVDGEIGGPESGSSDYEVTNEQAVADSSISLEKTAKTDTISLVGLLSGDTTVSFDLTAKNTGNVVIDYTLTDNTIDFTAQDENTDLNAVANEDYKYKSITLPTLPGNTTAKVYFSDSNGTWHLAQGTDGVYNSGNNVYGVQVEYIGMEPDAEITATLHVEIIKITNVATTTEGDFDSAETLGNIKNTASAIGTYGETSTAEVTSYDDIEVTLDDPTISLDKTAGKNKVGYSELSKDSGVEVEFEIEVTTDTNLQTLTLEDLGIKGNDDIAVDITNATLTYKETPLPDNITINGLIATISNAQAGEIYTFIYTATIKSTNPEITAITNTAIATGVLVEGIEYTAEDDADMTVDTSMSIKLKKSTVDENKEINLFDEPGGFWFTNKDVKFKLELTNDGEQDFNYVLHDSGLTFTGGDGTAPAYEFKELQDDEFTKITGSNITVAQDLKEFTYTIRIPVGGTVTVYAVYTLRSLSSQIPTGNNPVTVNTGFTKITNTAIGYIENINTDEGRHTEEKTADIKINGYTVEQNIAKSSSLETVSDNDIYTLKEADFKIYADLETNVTLESFWIEDTGLVYNYPTNKALTDANVDAVADGKGLADLGWIKKIEISEALMTEFKKAINTNGTITLMGIVKGATAYTQIADLTEVKDYVFNGAYTKVKVLFTNVKPGKYAFGSESNGVVSSGIGITVAFDNELIVKVIDSIRGTKSLQLTIVNSAAVGYTLPKGYGPGTGIEPEVDTGALKVQVADPSITLKKSVSPSDKIDQADINTEGKNLTYTVTLKNGVRPVQSMNLSDTGITADDGAAVAYSFTGATIKVNTWDTKLSELIDEVVITGLGANPITLTSTSATSITLPSNTRNINNIVIEAYKDDDKTNIPANLEIVLTINATITKTELTTKVLTNTATANAVKVGGGNVGEVTKTATNTLIINAEAGLTKTAETIAPNNNLSTLYDSDTTLTYSITVTNESRLDGTYTLTENGIELVGSTIKPSFTSIKYTADTDSVAVVKYKDTTMTNNTVTTMDAKSFTVIIEELKAGESITFTVTATIPKLTDYTKAVTSIKNSATGKMTIAGTDSDLEEVDATITLTNDTVGLINPDLSKTANTSNFNVVQLERGDMELAYTFDKFGHATNSSGVLPEFNFTDSGLTVYEKGTTTKIANSKSNPELLWISEIILPAFTVPATETQPQITVTIYGTDSTTDTKTWPSNGLSLTGIKATHFEINTVALAKGFSLGNNKITVKGTLSKELAKKEDFASKMDADGDFVTVTNNASQSFESANSGIVTLSVKADNRISRTTDPTASIIKNSTSAISIDKWLHGDDADRTLVFEINGVTNDSQQLVDEIRVTDSKMGITFKEDASPDFIEAVKDNFSIEKIEIIRKDSVVWDSDSNTKILYAGDPDASPTLTGTDFEVALYNVPTGLDVTIRITVLLDKIENYSYDEVHANIEGFSNTAKGTFKYGNKTTTTDESEKLITATSDDAGLEIVKQIVTNFKKETDIKDYKLVDVLDKVKENNAITWHILAYNDRPDTYTIDPVITDDLPLAFFSDINSVGANLSVYKVTLNHQTNAIENVEDITNNIGTGGRNGYELTVNTTQRTVTVDFAGNVLGYKEAFLVVFQTSVAGDVDSGTGTNIAKATATNAAQVSDEAIIKVVRTSSLNIKKEVHGNLDYKNGYPIYTQFPNVSNALPGSDIIYRFHITNYKPDAEATNIIMGDTLPSVDDTAVSSSKPRGSQFSVKFLEFGTFEFIDINNSANNRPLTEGADYDVYVTDSTDSTVVNTALASKSIDPSVWKSLGEGEGQVKADDVTSFVVVFKDEVTLSANQKIEFTLTAQMPDDAEDTYVAWDSCAAVIKDADIAEGLKVGVSPLYASIGDRVWFDTNASGLQVDPDTSTPDIGIPGINVYLFRVDADGEFLDIDENTNLPIPYKKTVTVEDGRYLFDYVPHVEVNKVLENGVETGRYTVDTLYYRVVFELPDNAELTAFVEEGEKENISDGSEFTLSAIFCDGVVINGLFGSTRNISLPEGGVDLTWDCGIITKTPVTLVKQLNDDDNERYLSWNRNFAFNILDADGIVVAVLSVNSPTDNPIVQLKRGTYTIVELGAEEYNTRVSVYQNDVRVSSVEGKTTTFTVTGQYTDNVSIVFTNSENPDEEIPVDPPYYPGSGDGGSTPPPVTPPPTTTTTTVPPVSITIPETVDTDETITDETGPLSNIDIIAPEVVTRKETEEEAEEINDEVPYAKVNPKTYDAGASISGFGLATLFGALMVMRKKKNEKNQ